MSEGSDETEMLWGRNGSERSPGDVGAMLQQPADGSTGNRLRLGVAALSRHSGEAED